MTGAVRVFVNERPVSVATGATVRDAVAVFDETLAGKLAAGAAYVTDGVGRPAEPGAAVTPGAIIRVVVSARRSEEPETAE
ncbi:MAG: hypothetical protein EXR93_04925 [Gemmatimonadetes bacterium]|nr:hypothetical protein [Gemmatimonadota bacterium]